MLYRYTLYGYGHIENPPSDSEDPTRQTNKEGVTWYAERHTHPAASLSTHTKQKMTLLLFITHKPLNKHSPLILSQHHRSKMSKDSMSIALKKLIKHIKDYEGYDMIVGFSQVHKSEQSTCNIPLARTRTAFSRSAR